MLSRESKLIITFFILFLVYSCTEYGINNNEQFSKKIVGDKEYSQIYKQANDSLNNWAKNKLGLFQYQNNGIIYKVDKILCFNNDKNKFVGCLLNQCTSSDCVQDDIWFFFGAKIKDTWYFFQGADITLPREMYQKDITKPLSFEKLHEIAMKEVFSGYLKKRNPIPILNILFPMYEVNEAWFDQKFKGVGWGCGTWIDEDGDGNSEWVDTCSEEEFNKMYYTKYHSVWELPADKSLFDMNIKRWTWITTDSFNRLFQAKKIDSFGYPYGTKYDREKNEITFPDGTRF